MLSCVNQLIALQQVTVLTILNGISCIRCDSAMASQNCDEEKPTSFALVPYTNDGILSQFYETEKIVNVPRIENGIKITQDWQSNGVAGVIWEAARVLCDYISKHLDLENKKVLELGAGTGLVGIASAAFGANVTITDIKKALTLLQENIDLNFPMKNINRTVVKPTVKELEWGTNLEQFSACSYDYILGADIIYMEETFDALFKTLCYLTSCNTGDSVTKIILSSKLRYDRVETFISRLKAKFTSVKKVHEDSSTNVVIYECY